ncbi:hypothetical protein FOFC_05064 [Fusarium oxysporum]|nr:hypothetical protein FOFC_05064 [Fusarium oxysporum]
MEALLRSMNFNLELYVCRYDNHPTLFRRLCIVLTFCYKANCRSNIQKAIPVNRGGRPIEFKARYGLIYSTYISHNRYLGRVSTSISGASGHRLKP